MARVHLNNSRHTTVTVIFFLLIYLFDYFCISNALKINLIAFIYSVLSLLLISVKTALNQTISEYYRLVDY